MDTTINKKKIWETQTKKYFWFISKSLQLQEQNVLCIVNTGKNHSFSWLPEKLKHIAISVVPLN